MRLITYLIRSAIMCMSSSLIKWRSPQENSATLGRRSGSACSSELSDDDPDAPSSSPAPPPKLLELCSPRRLRPSPPPLRRCGGAPPVSLRDQFISLMAAPSFPSSSLRFFGCLSSAIGLHGFLHSNDSVLRASLQPRGLHARSFFSLPQNLGNTLMLAPDGVVYGLIGANVAVFVLWKIADSDFMRDNFMISLDNIKNWYLHTMLTSTFSHEDAGHLVFNMIFLHFFGTRVAKMFGVEFFLTLYLAGALGGSIFFLVHRAILGRSSEVQRFYHSAVAARGASDAVNSIYLLDIFFCYSYYDICPVVPVPAVLVIMSIGDDLWTMTKGDKRISGAAHLGGSMVAILVTARMKGWI